MRVIYVLAIGVVVLGLTAAVVARQGEARFDPTPVFSSAEEELMISTIEQFRAGHGLSSELIQAKSAKNGARQWAEHLNAECEFSHGEGNLSFEQQRGADYGYPAGSKEILALSTEGPSGADYIVNKGWALSPSHYDALVLENARFIGVSIVEVKCSKMLDYTKEPPVMKNIDRKHYLYVVHIIPEEVK